MAEGDRIGPAAAGRLTELLAAVEELYVADLPVCDNRSLRRFAEQSVGVQSWFAAFDARLAAEVATRPTGVGDGRHDPANVLTGGGRRSQRDARAAADRGRACVTVPELAAALAAGEVSANHLDAVAAATKGLDEAATDRFATHGEQLATDARFDTPEEFRRRCQQLAQRVADDGGLARQERLRSQRCVKRWTDPDGMCHTKVSLDPLADAQIWAVLNHAIATVRAERQDGDPRTWDQLQADAFVGVIARANHAANQQLTKSAGLATGHDSAGGDGQAPVDGAAMFGTEVSVLIDLETLTGRAAAAGLRVSETSDGQPLPAATIRRLCCDARIVPIVLGGDGVPLDVGRSRRFATRGQRRALRAMHATCAHPSCTVKFDACRIHHITWWEQHFGPTDLANLLPLCEFHHHLVHEGGWTLTLTADQVAIWTRPDGTVAHHSDSRDRCERPAEPAGRTVTELNDRAGAGEVAERSVADSNRNVTALGAALQRRRQRRTATTSSAPPGSSNDELPRLFAPINPVGQRGPPAAG